MTNLIYYRSRSLRRPGRLSNIIRPLSDAHARLLRTAARRDPDLQAGDILGAAGVRHYGRGARAASRMEASAILREGYCQHVPGRDQGG